MPLQLNCLLSHAISCHVHTADTTWLWSHNYTFIAASNDTCLLVSSEIIMCWLLCGCGLDNYLSRGRVKSLLFCQSPWLNPPLPVCGSMWLTQAWNPPIHVGVHRFMNFTGNLSRVSPSFRPLTPGRDFSRPSWPWVWEEVGIEDGWMGFIN